MGKLIVIEGLDGSGKETQSKLLYNKMLEAGYKVKLVSFPRYDSESSALVKMYLRGDFGDNPDEISPYVSSTFYAADRYVSFKKELEEFYNGGGIIVADRYTTSNMIHQGGKIESDEELVKYLEWLWDFEFNIYKIPVPDMVYFLDTPLKVILQRIKTRPNKITKGRKKDIHESHQDYLIKSYNNVYRLVDMYNWKRVACTVDERNLSPEEINKLIYEDVKSSIKEGI